MAMPNSTKTTTIFLLRKQRASTVKLRNRRRTIKRSVITAPRTRSYRPYFLRSSSKSSYKVRSQWKKYKTNGCANYDILCTIFGQAVATGVLHYASTQEPPSREEEQHLEEELRAQGPVLGSGVGLDSTVDLDDITMTPSTQGRVSQRRAPRRRRRDAAGPSFSPVLSAAIQKLAATSEQRLELDAKMFELCSTKRSRGEGSNSGSDAGFSSVAQCMKFLQDITPPLPPDVHLRAVKAFMDPHVLNVFQNMTPAMRIDWVWSLS